ncbi:MAG TPA: nucleoside recognition domain-containing protein, partial [Candidatus Cloacimonadota bacterium]|nr:nucleoside recognition domain-containing protein [Candidatus Cloacimonadota bacterium]
NFVMELPPYHLPTLNGILLHTWHRLKDFILRAGKTILIVIIVINILQVITLPNFFHPGQERVSILELGGKLITPILQPMGISSANWPASVALITGLFAKEAIVGTLQSLYTPGLEASVSMEQNLRAQFGGWPAVIAYLLFVVLYSPCAAALTMLFKEHGVKWTVFSFIYLTFLAWIIATLFYQIAAFNADSWYWILTGLAFFSLIYWNLKHIGSKDATSA